MRYPLSARARSLLPGTLRPVALAALAVSMGAANAQNLGRGQELFQHHCQACHFDFQKPESRHVESLEKLRKRVEGWALHTGTDWTQEEIDDVLFYLNRMFYKFPEKAL